MAEKKVTTTTENTEIVHRARGFWEKNSRPIIIAGSVIILLIAGWYGYQEFIKKPKEKKANEAIFAAESLFDKMASQAGFNKDSSIIVLNGSKEMDVTGVLKVIKDYGGTDAGNRAEYIAGATYLHLKEFPKAIEHLKEFDANSAYQVKSKAYIMLGHAYAEQNKTDDALDYYKKAAAVNTKDESTTGDALFLAASYADASGKKKEAVDLYTELKNDYPNYLSVKSGDVDKYLARLGIFK
jgi:tetratricopeptide (TPR) repeat protein